MVASMTIPASRRPLTSRDTGWARAIAAWLVRRGAGPDLISALSLPLAFGAAAALVWTPAPLGPLLCAIGTQGRLLCNLFDGMVAIEGGRGGATGPLWNELPDRVADSVLIVALGVAAGHADLGWAGALMAALTAYVRATGGALGFAQDFSGLMAKPQRMAVLTLACLIAASAPWWPLADRALLIASWVIAIGAAWTTLSRTRRIALALKKRAAATPETSA